MGVRFEVVTARVRELDGITSPHLLPVELAWENARRKAKAVAALRPGRWILGADTVVALDKKIMGKPASIDQARDFLRTLSGQTHEVITGCALIAPDGEMEIFHDISRVTFADAVARDNRPLPRRSARARQGGRLRLAGARANGSSSAWRVRARNVIGLPTEALEKVLLRRGLLAKAFGLLQLFMSNFFYYLLP